MLLHSKTNIDAHNKSKPEVISIEILKIESYTVTGISQLLHKSAPFYLLMIQAQQN